MRYFRDPQKQGDLLFANFGELESYLWRSCEYLLDISRDPLSAGGYLLRSSEYSLDILRDPLSTGELYLGILYVQVIYRIP